MTYEEIAEMLEEMGLPFAYHHYAEGESPAPPFAVLISRRKYVFGRQFGIFQFQTAGRGIVHEPKAAGTGRTGGGSACPA